MTRVSTIHASLFSLGLIAAGLTPMSGASANEAYSSLVASHAAAHGLPPSLVHRVIMRESRYNPRAVSKGNYGMMQIRLGTARAMGYGGSAAGLLDANTNMTYAVKYLAGAYRAAGGNPDRAVALYASGYGGGRSSRGVARPDMADHSGGRCHRRGFAGDVTPGPWGPRSVYVEADAPRRGYDRARPGRSLSVCKGRDRTVHIDHLMPGGICVAARHCYECGPAPPAGRARSSMVRAGRS